MRDERSQLKLACHDVAQGVLGGGAMVFAVAHEHETRTKEMARLEPHLLAEHAEERHAAPGAIHEKLDRRGQASEVDRVVEGGGIARSGLPRIWTYLYSTAKSPLPDLDPDASTDAAPAVLAGYGYGLPLSRLYARYFGGDLQVISMEGYGTDAFLHLNRLGNVQEPLP